ncbi:rCG46622 [Rattus norvegicus]|uniref:RCG46622 n=1 Tax=Rattus norvegicus TaxID=10116 RepID=A6IX02_RAT|nr:rCG46622 [Rattus norvegicus]
MRQDCPHKRKPFLFAFSSHHVLALELPFVCQIQSHAGERGFRYKMHANIVSWLRVTSVPVLQTIFRDTARLRLLGLEVLRKHKT